MLLASGVLVRSLALWLPIDIWIHRNHRVLSPGLVRALNVACAD